MERRTLLILGKHYVWFAPLQSIGSTLDNISALIELPTTNDPQSTTYHPRDTISVTKIHTIRGEMSMLATRMTVEFSTRPMAATNAATISKKSQSNVNAASDFTTCNTWAKFCLARTEDVKRVHFVLLSLKL